MKQMLIIIILTMLSANCHLPVLADTDISIDGQIRIRPEFSNRNFTIPKTTKQFTLLRTRVSVTATIEKNTKAVVQFQDSRIFGDSTGSGGLEDREKVDIHQAYINVKELWKNGPGIKAGRFELNLGNQRVFGAVGWHNVGRSWDGFMAWYQIQQLTINALYLKKLETNNEEGDRDFDVFGIYTHCERYNVDLFFIYERDHEYEISRYYMHRYSAGTYFNRTVNNLDFEFNGVYQFGYMRYYPTNDIDIAAYMFTAEAGYSSDSRLKPRIAVGIDYTSGDDDTGDNKHETYDNLYYTGHKFRGYYDQFIGSPVYGLVDMIFRAKVNPTDGWTVNGDFHYFTAAADYMYNSAKTKDIGMEFDLTVSTVRVSGAGITAGASYFMPREAYAGFADPEPGFWFYTQLTANFK